jgi:predicted DNA-binding transcriptional regulator AlpA
MEQSMSGNEKPSWLDLISLDELRAMGSAQDAKAPRRTAPAISNGVPILYDAVGLAHALAISVKSLRRMNNAGRLPRPVKIGIGDRNLRWRREEIEAWCAAGCPDRQTWEGAK